MSRLGAAARRRFGVRAVLLLATLLPLAAPAFAATPAEICTAAKMKAAGMYASCLQKVESKAVMLDRVSDVIDCNKRLLRRWGKAEAAGAGQCPTSGDAGTVAAFIDQHAEEVAGVLAWARSNDAPLTTGQTTCYAANGTVIACAGSGQDGELQHGAAAAFVDNGDGTITDPRTGLMWEKLSDDDSIHDVDTQYMWPDAALTKVGALNSGAFAGHSDWRLPKLRELQTLANYGAANPATDPAFNTGCAPGCTILTCSCTAAAYYWSSTPYVKSFQLSTGLAWVIDFSVGLTTAQQHSNPYRARAVRSAP